MIFGYPNPSFSPKLFSLGHRTTAINLGESTSTPSMTCEASQTRLFVLRRGMTDSALSAICPLRHTYRSSD